MTKATIAAIESYEIKMAGAQDGPAIRTFIERYWKSGHALAASQELFNWQHLDPSGKGIHFMLAKARGTGDILAVLGYIPTSQFDAALLPEKECWLAIWKVREDIPAGAVGLQLYFQLEQMFRPRSVGSISFSETSRPLYTHLKFTVGKLSHYYAVNPALRSFSLLGKADRLVRTPLPAKDGRIDVQTVQRLPVDLPTYDFFTDRVPRKTPAYFSKRYSDHPIYRYEQHLIFASKRCVGLAVTRVVEANGSRAVKIVDLVCTPEGYPGLAVIAQKAFTEQHAEYVDFYGAGYDGALMKAAGFSLRSDTDEGIVPNYFEPFEKRNVSLNYAVKTDRPELIRLTRGDSDQDRPTLLRGTI